ncbi:protein NLRC5-like isoform X7 [Alosa sapidissima]|uniref:protein NLRC5-like isoform X7 n=1 Tax=Alosa sapidissima TaxID=34773 RepID=UPI001C09EB18|nr:protein NLRC5-like isoform X7 [Alosa sapidissima]
MAVNSLDLLFRTLDELESAELKRFRTYLSERTVEGFEPIPRGKLEGKDATDVASMMKNAYGEEGSVKMTLTILRKMNLNNLVDKLERPQTQRPPSPVPSGVSMNSMPEHPTFSSGPVPSGLKDVAESGDRDVDAILQEVKAKYKEWMIEKFGKIHECIEDGKNKTLLRKIYTELYITEGESEGVNTQHEIRRIETQIKFQRANEDKINCNDIFKCLPDQEKIRTVMTTGIAGIGKSVCVQKFILDWAEERAHQDVDFIFALPFRQLNLKQNDSYSLHKLLHVFHKLNENDINPDVLCKLKIMFIFDGLDESKLPLNVEQDMDDPLKTASVDVLITNLITGNLLPNALIWITSRPAAVKMIPPKYIDRWTEVQGFNDQQKDEYFKKKIENPAKIARIKRSKSLYIMCHIPVFCWILASVLLKMNSHTNTSDLPQTLTEVYICFLLTETNRKGQKYGKGFERDDKKRLKSNKDAILKLSELAYKELLKGNILFYEDNLNECGINEEDITLYSGMCSEFFMSECAVDQRKVYCFVHLSIQEFLAALFVFHSFVTKNTEALRQFISQESLSNLSMAEFLRTAIDKSMQKEDGQLDLFLRFLLGMSLESNQKLLQGLLTHIESSSDSLKETAEHIKRILSKDTKVPERCMNLLLCLLEMKDNSLHQEIQQYIDSGEKLSPAQCSTLAYMLLVSEETLDELDLAKYKSSNEGRQRLLIVVKACRKARLVGCELKEESCRVLTSALQSEYFLLKELDLSSNPLKDSGVRLLSVGLKHANCRLETLRLVGCGLTEESCEVLTSALQSEHSLLKELDLSSNPLMDSGVRLLSVGLKHTNCKMETLSLADCKITHNSCEIVVSVLQSTNALIKLDLGENDLGDSGVKLLSKGLSSPDCKLQTLRLAKCKLLEKSCGIVATVLQSPNSLIELDLSHNDLRDSGVQLLSKGLSSPHCKLQTLRLAECTLTEKSFVSVASVLQSSNSLIELDLSHNDLRDSGVQLVSKGLTSPHCKLQTLRCAESNLTDKFCEIMASVLQSPNSLLQLDLSDLGDSGVQLLSKGLSNHHCKLHTLRLAECKLSEKSCGIVATVLQSPNSLIELDLSHNDVGDTGVQLVSKGLSSPRCKLHTLRLAECTLSEKSCRIVATVLQSPNSLIELDLSHNDLGDSGVQLLFKGLSSHCKLQTLRFAGCILTDKSCEIMASVLQSPNSLIELDLSHNDLGDLGVQLLFNGLSSPYCALQTLRFAGCKLTDQSCEIVTSVLQSVNSAQLQQLDLSHNDLGDSGVQPLSKGLSSPYCNLQTLRLRKCGFSDEGYVCLALTLMLNPSCVKKLDVNNNHPGESAQKLLSSTLKDPHRKVEALRFAGCKLTFQSCEIVTLVLQSTNLAQLRHLDLSHNDLGDSGVQLLSKGLSSPHCKLQILRLRKCGFSDEGYVCLALTLMLNPTCVKELDVSNNYPGGSAQKLLSATLEDPHRKVEALRLAECTLTEKSFVSVATVLQSPNVLIELDLSHNDLRDSRVQLLSKGLSSLHCKLRALRLSECTLSEKSCGIVATVLQSPNSLIELDLSHNDLRDSGVQLLSTGLYSSHCKLQALRLAECKLSEKSCEIVATALQSPNSLIKLDLSYNDLRDSGVQLLMNELSSSHYRLQTVRFAGCKLSEKSCGIVATVLKSPNSLIELDLSHNDLGDSGVQLLSKGLSSPHCKLHTLRLAECKLLEKYCGIVATVLQSPNSMIELDLSHNYLGDSGVQLLSKGLSSPHCKLQTLRVMLADCKLTDKLCKIVTSVLQSPNSLLLLDLSGNDLGDSGTQLLSEGLSSSNCILQTLRLADCKLAEKSCEIVASILQLPNSLLQLDLSDNELGDSGVQLLSKGLSSSNCKIHTLRLSDCLILEKGCGFLASALRSNPFHLKEMDLSYNHPGESGLELLSGRLEDPVCKLELLKTDDASVSRTRPCLLKYACELTVDPNTAGRNLSLSDGNRKVTRASEKQLYPDHPERFDWKYQVLCRESLSGRCYWEAEWSGDAARIAVAYKSIKRKGEADDIIMGLNAKSWSLRCSPDSYSAWHNNKHTVIPSPSSRSRRVGVYLDWPDGTLSFYSVSSDTLTHLHTFHSTFTEPLCPGFWVWSSVSLCQILHLRHSVSNRKRWLLHRFYSNLKNFISTFENTSVLQPKNKIVW